VIDTATAHLGGDTHDGMLLLSLLFACQSPTPPAGVPPVCAASAPAEGEVQILAEGLEHDGDAGTEGLVFSPDGRLFVGGAAYAGGGFVAEVFPNGDHEVITDLAGTVGLEWWHDQLVVAVGADGAAGEQGGIVLVAPDSGDAVVFAEGIPSANFPVVTPWDTLLVSAPSGGEIWEVDTNGGTSVWVGDLVSPNGMVFDAAGETLYVAQTYEVPNQFRAIEVRDDHSAGTVTELALFDPGSTQDGVALDANGDVYVVLNLPGEVVRVTPAGDTTVVASGVDFGASMRFGRGDFNPCSLYVTSLFSDALFEVGVGVAGAN
jgi:hypothetical protein